MVTHNELQHLHSYVYLSSCPSHVNIDRIIHKALVEYIDSRKEEVDAWNGSNEESEN